MADVHALISLGLGSPADIPYFILTGLSTFPVLDPEAVDPSRIWIVADRATDWNVDPRVTTWTVE